jgi:hypothetical protein
VGVNAREVLEMPDSTDVTSRIPVLDTIFQRPVFMGSGFAAYRRARND